MRICFPGFEGDIEIHRGESVVLEVNNRVLFARVCASIAGGFGDGAVEPYSVWDDSGDEIKASTSFLYVGDPLNLPWDNRAMAGALAGRFEKLLFEDEAVRVEAESAFNALRTMMGNLSLQLQADYAFGIDWDVKRYLKSFGFGVDLAEDGLLIDKIIEFLLLAEDVCLKKVIVFVNLKLFLSKKELERVFEQVFCSGLNVFFLETEHDSDCYAREKRYIIDQDLLEIWPSKSVGLFVSSQ